MRQGIKELQSSKVTELVNIYMSNEKEITFKAPTGSGKTYMMADFMNRILDSKTVFIVSSLSKGQLAEQNHEKFIQYSTFDFIKIRPYLINSDTVPEEKLHIPLDYNVYSLPRDLFKKNSKLMEGPMELFLTELKARGKNIILIRDECHQATNNLDKLNTFFYKVINFSATPQPTRFFVNVELTEEEAIREKLIKVNQNSINNTPFTLEEQLSQLKHEAIPLFLKIKKEYNEQMGINPALIIQISNKTKGINEWLKIKKIIDDPSLGLKWMYIAEEGSKDNDTNDEVKKLPGSAWRQYAKNNEAPIDVIVFKMVITEGWDIPRACMLFQIRDTESITLDEQVYGRIRRNPILTTWDQHNINTQNLALKCWVWGFLAKNQREFKKVNLKPKYNVSFKTTVLKDLRSNPDFNLREFLNNKKQKTSTDNIFLLYKKWNNISDKTSSLAWNYIKDYNDWFDVSQNILEIDNKNKAYLKDYNKSMIEGKPVTLSTESYYEKTEHYLEINDWVWLNHLYDDNEFHFDSEAEKEFAKILRNTNNPFWGKNYYPNSELCFEYFDGTIKKSYPDFVLKDKNGNIHIFEIKSLNQSQQYNINKAEYDAKIFKLAECYKYASKVTPYTFYIPIQIGNKWIIEKYTNGIYERIVKVELVKLLTM